jgi:branched-chain amino acid aminotransferase
MPWDRETLNEAQRAVVRENGLASAYIRPMCFYGSEGMGLRADNLKVHCMVAAWSWGAYLGEDNMRNGIRIRVSSFTRHHVNITMCRAKANGNYMNSMLALQEALRDGYDEALLLDAEGYVMEGSGENIFIVRGGVLYTPDLTSALDGITRGPSSPSGRGAGAQGGGEAHHPRRGLHRRRGLLHRHRRRGDPDPRGGRPHHRQRHGRGPITERLQALYFDQVHGRIRWSSPLAQPSNCPRQTQDPEHRS